MNDDGVVVPRRTRRAAGDMRLNQGETYREKKERVKRENEEWAALASPVVIKRKAKK